MSHIAMKTHEKITFEDLFEDYNTILNTVLFII